VIYVGVRFSHPNLQLFLKPFCDTLRGERGVTDDESVNTRKFKVIGTAVPYVAFATEGKPMLM
jgi:hypothetical protein